jgi:type II secretory pathway component GspD/PulD (secretin)
MPTSVYRSLNRVMRFTATIGCVLASGILFAQSDEVVPDAQPPVATEPETAPRIGFAFKNAPFDQVLDFFSRQSGVPIIFESDAPAGMLTYVSSDEYEMQDAISILNLMLRRHDRYLRHEGEFLYLSSLPEAVKRTGESFNGRLPEGISPDQIVTVTIPLNNANAALVAEQITPLLDSYGSVTPVSEQNIVIIVETAAQIERISQVIATIDERKPVDSSYKLFPLRNAKPEDVVESLKGLVGQRVQRIIIDKDGKQRVVEDIDVGGLNIQADVRSNAVIVVGPESRIQTVEELIALLDADEPGSVGNRTLVTLALEAVTPSVAASRLQELFVSVEESKRPTIVSLEQAHKIAIVGTTDQIAQATALVRELDPAQNGSKPEFDIARIISLDHLSGTSAQMLLGRLLSPRQQNTLRIVAGTDDRSLVVAGPEADIEKLEALISGLDRPASGSREVRVVRLDTNDPVAVFDSVNALYSKSNPDSQDLERSLDPDSASVTLLGSQNDVDAYVQLLLEAQLTAGLSTETRTYDVVTETPEIVADRLNRVVAIVLDGRGTKPTIQPIPELAQIVVRAQPAQFTLIEGLIAQITEKNYGDFRVEVVRFQSDEPEQIIRRAKELALLEYPQSPEATVQYDESSGYLIVTGTNQALMAFSSGLERAQLMTPPARTTRYIDIQRASAEELVEPLQAFLLSADSIDPGRRVPEPSISAVTRTNSLLIVAEPLQHQLILEHIQRLDVLEQADLPPLRLLQLRTAEANSIASMLTDQYRQRPQSERTSKPVEVRADTATNTLIVAAHEDLFADIRAFVDTLNTEQSEGPERLTKLFPLSVARASDVASAMDRLYPEPPVPLDRRGNPMPWLREPKQVTVSYEQNSNSLIIDAPADRMVSLTELAEQLDRVQVPAAAELRTYRVENADIQVIAQALTGLASRGVLSSPAQAGRQAVQVLIETEPRSKTLIVAGDVVTFEKVEQMLADLSAVPVENELRIVPITGQLATDIARRAEQIYAVQTSTLPDAKPIDVTVDDQTNTLQIVGESDAMARFLSVLDELQSQTGPSRQIRLVELRASSVSDVTAFLTELMSTSSAMKQHGGPMPTFEAIESTNSILISATREDWAVIDPLVVSLDTADGQQRPPLRILKLRSTDASNIAAVLQHSFDRRSTSERATMPVDIKADASTNTLIVAAHQDVLPEIEQIVLDLNDAQAIDDAGRGIQIFPLKIARAEELALTIDQMYPEPPVPFDSRGRPRPDLRGEKEISVRADVATNSLIVDAPSARLAGFEQLVRELDRAQATEDVEVRTYQIKRADIDSVNRTLRELADRNALGASGRSAVTISSEQRGRSLVVSGPVEIFDAVESVIESLDTPPDMPPRVLRFYRLDHARADKLVEVLKETLTDQARQVLGDSATDESLVLSITADSGSNTLIISATEAIQNIAAELVQALDSQAAAGSRHTVRVITLLYADSNSVAPTLSAAAGAMDMASTDQPLIRAVRGVNSIVLSGSSNDVERLADLVSSLDTRPVDSESPGIETFELEHALAGEISETVERLLVNQLETDPRVMAVRLRYTRADAPPAPKVRVESDSRTNTLVVSAPSATLELARVIVSKLDEPSGEQPTMVTYTPSRSRPSTLADIVNRVLDQTSQNRSITAELFVELSSGSIVVTGEPDQVAHATGLLSEFDDRTILIPETTFRTIQLEHASSLSLAQTLTNIFSDKSRWPADLIAAADAGVPVASPVFTPNVESNSLVVVTPLALVELVDQLIASFDNADSRGQAITQVFSIHRGNASSIAEVLATSLNTSALAGEPPISVSAEPISNSVVVAASSRMMQQAVELISQLDQTIDSDGVSVRTIVLKHARADSLAPIIEQIVSRKSATDLMPSWMLGSYLANGGDVRQETHVIAESRLNSLVVTGPIPVLDLVEQVVAELDVAKQIAVVERPVRVLAIRNADANTVAGTIEAIFAEDSSSSTPPVLRVDTDTNVIVVRADSEQFVRIDQLVAALDQAAVASSKQLRRISVDPSRLSATEMAELLRGLVEEQSGARVEIINTEELLKDNNDHGTLPPVNCPHTGHVLASTILQLSIAIPEIAKHRQEISAQPEVEETELQPDVVITVDSETNTLIVTGSTVMTDRLAELALELESMAPPSPTRARFIRLPDGVDPNAVAQLLTRTSQQIGIRSDSNPGGFTSRVAAAADRGGNSIVVWANDTDFESISPLIAAMATPTSTSPRVVKVYPLSSVRANRAITAVRDFVSPSPAGRQARRVRATSVSIQNSDGSSILAELDSSQISISAGPGNTSLVVSAPAESISAIDKFISLIDQSPSESHMAIRRYVLEYADPQALSRSLTQLFNAQRQANPDLPRPSIVADTRGNTLLVSAANIQHQEITDLLSSLDIEQHDDSQDLEIFRLTHNRASSVSRAINTLLLSRDPVARSKIQLSADDTAGVMLVRAPKEDLVLIRKIVNDLDQQATTDLPIHQISVERADAVQVASAIHKFFADLDSIAGRSSSTRNPRIAITADSRSGSIIVAANDKDFEQIKLLIETFDGSPEAKDLRYRIYRLEHARASDVGDVVQNISWSMQSDRSRAPAQAASGADRLYIESNERLNAIVVLASPDRIDTIERIIKELDVPTDSMGELTLRAIVLERSDANAVARVITESTATPGWRFWQGRDPDAVVAQVDRMRNAVLLVGRKDRVELAEGFVDEIERAGSEGGDIVSTIRLEHARADRAAGAINRFFQQRARAQGIAITGVTVIGSADGNVVVIAANDSDTALINGMISDIDQPEMGQDRAIEVYILSNANVAETSRTVSSMFPSRGGRSEDRVIVTPQNQSNSLIISAPTKLHEPIAELISELDSPPSDENTRILTVTLESAVATDIAISLRAALPDSIKVKITPVERSNSLLLTGSEEAIQIVMQRIEELDAEPLRDFMEFKRVHIKHADAFDIYSTLRTVVRSRPVGPSGNPAGIDYDSDENTISLSATADDLDHMLTIIEQLDTPRDIELRTEFVSLEFANATQVAEALDMFFGPFAVAAATPGARRVTIVPDAASNSLVISADGSEWDNIMTLLSTLDNEKYDTSRQLAVIKLDYADAASVAGAIGDGFQATLESGVRRDQARQQSRQQNGRNDQITPPPVLIRDEDLPTVSAERETNSLVIFATRRDLDRIRAIVEQIDRAEFVEYPEAKIIAIRAGKPSEIAKAVRDLYSQQDGRQGKRSVLVFGDDSSRTLIVRADDSTFLQIKALAEAVQDQSDERGVRVRVLALTNTPAARIHPAVMAAFQQTAATRGESLSIQIDRSSNALVIASTQELYNEIQQTVQELDSPAGVQPESSIPGVFGNIQIVDVANNDPIRIIQVLSQLGVTQPSRDDQPGLVGDPVKLSPLTSRRAIAITGSAVDVATVANLIPSIDLEAVIPTHTAAIIPLQVADASEVVSTLGNLLSPAVGASGASPAQSASEHLRRLSIAQGAAQPLELDLSTPIRLMADTTTNSVIAASSQSNISGIQELAEMMDKLPIGEAVVIRVFPMSSASADRVQTIISDLFRQGSLLGTIPGTNRIVSPSTATGQALLSEIALSVDERSNSLIVAGREESVALVEVLISDLDAEQASTWVEPTLIKLAFADPRDIADRLNAVLVDGLTETPESLALQRQAGRLRFALSGRQQEEIINADLFTAAGTLIIEPEPNLQALLVLASPANLQVVEELVSMLDVEAASTSNTVRLFPLEFAAADRIVGIVTDLFNERARQPGFREEDRIVASLDARTNTIIVTTSPESFDVLESLIESLDSPDPNYAVGLHVISIDGGDAAQLAPKIQRLMRERISASQRAGSVSSPLDSFTVEAEPATNSLIVAASDENLVLVRELINTLTGEESRALVLGTQIEVIALSSTRPDDAASAVTEFYVTPENQRRGPGSVGVIANQRLNALVVRGTPDDIVAVRNFVTQIDTASPSAVQNVKRIELDTANAYEVVQLLEQVLSGRSVSGPRNRSGQAIKLRFYRQQLLAEIEETQLYTETEIDSVIREQVSLTPELRTNSVLVAAPPDVMAFIESMIVDLDTTSAGTRKIEKFRLANADARAMADVLRNLFSLRQSGQNNLFLVPSGQPTSEQTDTQAASDADDQSLTPVPDDRQQLAITIDARTNTLLVSATADYLDLVRDVVEELDSIIATEREQIVFDLQYAQADAVETTLQQYFQSEADRIRGVLSPGQGGSLTRQLEQEVTVVGDAKSQKVLISASPRYIDTVRQIVKELDAAPPQVIIQVLLAEVTLDESDQWGLTANAIDVGGDSYDIGFLGAGASLATALGVPNLSVSSTDFGLLVRALQAQGKLQILSNPRLTVNNNEAASIQVGENVALPDEVETLTDGRTRANIRREDVGVLLSVTPSISSDGFVRLDIQPEISTVTERTTQITEDFAAPIISTRKVDTTVTVRDGQTVVIGGLIQTTQQERFTKVPLFGDLPYIGSVFRSHDIQDVRTELLIILTPQVVAGGSSGGSEIFDLDTQRAIENYIDPVGLRSLLELHEPVKSEGAESPIVNTQE